MPSLIFMSLASGFGGGIILQLLPWVAYQRIYTNLPSSMELLLGESFAYYTATLKPTILYLLIMGTIGSFQVFAQIYLMTEGGQLMPLKPWFI